ncbi:MAG: lipoyl synthase [Nitrospirota bacterium]
MHKEGRLPSWLRSGEAQGEPAGEGRGLSSLHEVKRRLRGHGLSTVCEEARCPNKTVCFSKPTATFMILGDVCTRRCGFCAVRSGPVSPPDPREPGRVAEAARQMGLRYVVITSVTRDDLSDGGAGQFALGIRAVREALPGAKVEVLTPDFRGSEAALRTVLGAGPDVFNHNVETVPRLYSRVRPQADYGQSLALLRAARDMSPNIAVKSGLMLGLGETFDEVLEVMAALRGAGCGLLTIGQYLRPSRRNLPVAEYVAPEVFEALRERALEMGFSFAASSPLVRSSMNAEEMYGRAE